MMWLTWRQHRLEALGAALLVISTIAVIAGLIIAGQPLVEQAHRACTSLDTSCGSAIQAYYDRFATLHTGLKAMLLGLPVLAGLFIGAPLLAREFEQGTDQLVWSQGITRGQWLFVKLVMLIAATVCLAAALAVAGRALFEDQAIVDHKWIEFDFQGPAYVSYAFFSLALGVAAGAAIGRTVPAMAVALVGFVGVRMAITFIARPNFQAPLQWNVGSNVSPQGDVWTLGDQRHLDLQGHQISDAQYTSVVNTCNQVRTSFSDCLREHGVVVLQAYQPGDRFWLFQSIEAVIFMVIGIALLGLAVWLVARRA